jgi:hypothetical protein
MSKFAWIFPEEVGLDEDDLRISGGIGSGNFSHLGRPGEIGGSSSLSLSDAKHVAVKELDGDKFLRSAGGPGSGIKGHTTPHIGPSLNTSTPEDRTNSMIDYTTAGRAINEVLRGKPLSEIDPDEQRFLNKRGWSIEQRVHNMDDAVASSPPLPAQTLYRGMARSVIENLRPGDTFSDKGFVSTSRSEGLAIGWARGRGGGFLRIDIPAGTKGFDVSPANKKGEQEVLLPRDSTFDVLSTTGPAPYPGMPPPVHLRLRPE